MTAWIFWFLARVLWAPASLVFGLCAGDVPDEVGVIHGVFGFLGVVCIGLAFVAYGWLSVLALVIYVLLGFVLWRLVRHSGLVFFA